MKVLLLIGVVILFYILQRSYLVVNTKCNLDNVYSIADNGDIIYFRWEGIDNLTKIITPFTHIGIVIIDKHGKKYILETHLEGDGKKLGNEKGGINMYPMKERIKAYEGAVFLSKLKKPIEEQYVDKFFSKLPYYRKTIPFHNNYRGYIMKNCLPNRLCNDCFTNEEKKGLFCSEFIGFCLKELGLYEENYTCMIPGDFRYIKNKEGEYLYKDIIHIKK